MWGRLRARSWKDDTTTGGARDHGHPPANPEAGGIGSECRRAAACAPRLLDSTLVLWGGEFGRSPEAQGGKGRDHHNLGFAMWMAGRGIKGGQVIGATDDIGLRAIEQPVHFRDLHTTILHQLGPNQDQLSYMHRAGASG